MRLAGEDRGAVGLTGDNPNKLGLLTSQGGYLYSTLLGVCAAWTQCAQTEDLRSFGNSMARSDWSGPTGAIAAA